MLLVAHRMPETAAACARFRDAGADLFEVDLQLDSRGLISSHYVVVPRTGGRLQRDGWRPRWGLTERAPLIADLVPLVPPGARLLLDPKEHHPERRDLLVDAVIDAFPDRDRVAVSTADPRDLERFREAGFLTWHSVGDRPALEALLRAGRLAGSGVTVRHTLIDETTVRRLHELTACVVAWTVNRVSRARRLRDLGVDGITTDRPSVMRAMRAAPDSP